MMGPVRERLGQYIPVLAPPIPPWGTPYAAGSDTPPQPYPESGQILSDTPSLATHHSHYPGLFTSRYARRGL